MDVGLLSQYIMNGLMLGMMYTLVAVGFTLFFGVLDIIKFSHGDVLTVGAFTALATKKGLDFTLDIDAAVGVYRGDPTRVRQILYNLISNALKFTEAGDIRVAGTYDGEALRQLADQQVSA